QVAARNGGGNFGDVAHLPGQVAGHRVDVVGEILPHAADVLHVRLTAQLAFGTDFARHARDFRRERVELVHHRVDGLLQLQDLAAYVHRDLARQVAARDGGGYFGDVADLAGQVTGHRVDVLGEILPDTTDALDFGLAAQIAFRAHLARHARDFRRDRVELIDQRVDGFLQLQDLALHVRRDLARQVAVRDGGGHLGDVAHLAGEVAGHGIHAVGEVLPGAGDAGHYGLATQLAFGAHFARHACHFGSKRAQLIDHRIDGFLQLQNLAAYVHGNLARQVAARDGGGDFRDVTNLAGQIARHGVDVVGQILPGPGDSRHHRLAAQLAFGTHLARHSRGEAVELIHHRVDGVLELEDFALHQHRDLARQVATRDGGGHFRDVADLAGQIGRHRVDGVGEILPGAGDTGNDRLSPEFPFSAHLARHARHFRGKRAQLIDHRVNGLLQLQNLAAYIDGDLAGQVAVRNRDRHLGDVAHLAGEVAGHRVHVVGQILPGAGDTGHSGLTAEFALGTHFARHARDLGREGAHLLDHRVDDRGGSQEFSLERPSIHFQAHGLLQVACVARRNGACDLRSRPQQVVDEGIHRPFHRAPGAGAPVARHAMTGLAVLADDLPGTLQLARQALIGRHDLVECIGYLAREPCLIAGEPRREIAVAHRLQRPQEFALVETLRLGPMAAVGLASATLRYLAFHQQA